MRNRRERERERNVKFLEVSAEEAQPRAHFISCTRAISDLLDVQINSVPL